MRIIAALLVASASLYGQSGLQWLNINPLGAQTGEIFMMDTVTPANVSGALLSGYVTTVLTQGAAYCSGYSMTVYPNCTPGLDAAFPGSPTAMDAIAMTMALGTSSPGLYLTFNQSLTPGNPFAPTSYASFLPTGANLTGDIKLTETSGQTADAFQLIPYGGTACSGGCLWRLDASGNTYWYNGSDEWEAKAVTGANSLFEIVNVSGTGTPAVQFANENVTAALNIGTGVHEWAATVSGADLLLANIGGGSSPLVGITGGLTTTADMSIGGDLSVSGAGTSSIGGILTVSGSGASVSIAGTLTVSGLLTATGGCTGCYTPAADIMTTDTVQTVTGFKTFNVSPNFATGATFGGTLDAGTISATNYEAGSTPGVTASTCTQWTYGLCTHN